MDQDKVTCGEGSVARSSETQTKYKIRTFLIKITGNWLTFQINLKFTFGNHSLKFMQRI